MVVGYRVTIRGKRMEAFLASYSHRSSSLRLPGISVSVLMNMVICTLVFEHIIFGTRGEDFQHLQSASIGRHQCTLARKRNKRWAFRSNVRKSRVGKVFS